METNAVLIVDDSDTFRSAVRKCLSSKFELVEEAASVQEFEALYQRRRYDLVILDMRLDDRGEGRQGIELMRHIHALDELQPVIVVSSYGDADAGALTFLHKREFSPPLLARMADLVLRQAGIQRQLASLQTQLPHGLPYEMASVAASMREVDRRIRLAAADGRAMVVIGGPLGSGHEMAAAAIHRLAAGRSAGPWVCVSAQQIAASPDPRFVLWGAEGGASSRTRGLLDQAQGGTLFIDCFEALPVGWLEALGQALGERTLRHRASSPLDADVQLVAGTSVDGFDRVAAWIRTNFGSTRSVEIRLPALAERASDIATLVPYYLHMVRWSGRSQVRGMSPQTQAIVEAYAWPGNLAELRAVVEYAGLQASLAGRESIESVDLPDRLMAPRATTTEVNHYEWHLARAELSLVEAALAADRGQRREQTAQRLGYNDRFALGRRMRKALTAFPALRPHFPEVARHYGGHGRNAA
jgi:DNA-binding NtrC family response regulator